MTVRLIEKFSNSMPDWLKDAIKQSGYRKNYASTSRDYYYHSFDYSPVYGKRHYNYPLDSLTYEERPIPKNMATIRRDFEAGNDPVLRIRVDDWRTVDSKKDYVCIIHNTHNTGVSSATQFKKSWEEALRPVGYEPNWGDVKGKIADYGVIINGKQETRDLADKRLDRLKNRKYWKIPDPAEVERKSKYRQRRMKTGAENLRMFKRLDKLYDDITATFDEALEMCNNSSNDSEVNIVFNYMKDIKNQYDDAVYYIENANTQIDQRDDDDFYREDGRYGFIVQSERAMNQIDHMLERLKEKIAKYKGE